MIEPRRLHLDDDPVVASLLRAARSGGPEPARVRRIMGAAGVTAVALGSKAAAGAGAAAATASGAGVVTAASSAVVAVQWAVVGVVAGIATLAASAHLHAPRTLPAPATQHDVPAVVMDAPPAKGANVGSAPSAASAALADEAASPIATAAPASPHTRSHAAHAPTAPAAEAPVENTVATPAAAQLADEVHALALVKQSLNAGDAAGALESVRAYEARYRGGILAPEALYLEMEALARSGQIEQASKLAKRLLATNASVPSRERVREVASLVP